MRTRCATWLAGGAFAALVACAPGGPDVDTGPPGAHAWTRQFGTAGYDSAGGVGTDPDGSVYVAGTTQGDLGGPHGGGFSDGFVRAFDGDGAVRWTRQFGSDRDDLAGGVATDATGRVYVVGFTAGDLEGPNAGVADGFVRAYTRDGDLRWTRQFGTDAEDLAYGVATDGAGNVYVAGETRGALEGGNAGGLDAYVRSYDANGALRWTRQFGTAEDDGATWIAVDAAGHVYVSGLTYGDLGGPNAGAMDAFVRSYDADGALRWTRQFGTAGFDRASGVAAGVDGNVYVAGFTDGDLGGPSAGDDDGYLRSYAPDGALRWTRQFGTSGAEQARAVAIGANGHAYVVGHTMGSLDGEHAGESDAFVRSFDRDGALRWGRQFGTSSHETARAVATDPSGRVLLAGHTFGALVGASAGGVDAFLRRHAP